MNILFDHQVFSFQEYGGISRYYSQLIRLFSKRKDIHADLFVKYSNNFYLHDIDAVRAQPFFSDYRFKGRNEIVRLFNQRFFTKEYSKRNPPDIFHPTYYNPYFLEQIGDVPFVLTIYDMAHEMFPAQFHPLDFTVKNKKILVSKAARVIAISKNTSNDVVKMLGIPESSIDVIPLATNIRVDRSLKYPPSLPEQFILYVGARNTYKNFLFFLRALQPFIDDSKNLRVICAGGGAFSKQEMRNIDSLGLTKKIFQMNVNDGTLGLLYSKTQAFVYPSMYEGFGIPVIEAFTCGAPTLLSNRSSLPEVGGDAAAYFDPENIESLRSVLRNVLFQKDLKTEMIKKGYERAKLFSWERTAEMTIETYQKVLKKTSP